MWAKLKASFNVWGLNIQIPSKISVHKQPMNVPTRAFYVQPLTRLPKRSNPFGIDAKNQSVWPSKGLRQNLHTLKAWSKPRVHPQNSSTRACFHLPGMSYKSTATTGWPLLPSGKRPKKLFRFRECSGTQKIGSHGETTLSDHLLKIEEIPASLFWRIQQVIPHCELHGIRHHGLEALSLQGVH